MKQTQPLLKVAGIEIRIHWTFFLIILYIVYINMKAGQDAMQIGWSVLFVLSLFVCVTLHELGHALAAKRYGIKTKDITLYPIGGVARLEKMPERPQHELVVALAGPLVNVIIAAILLPVLLNSGILTSQEEPEKVLILGPSNFLPMLAIINLWLALFNLIPAFPMDGGRVLRALLAMKTGRLKATRIAAMIGKILAVGFVIAGFYMNPFLIFIGLFIILGAQAEAEMVKTQFFISDLTAGDALMTNYRTLDKNQPISDAVKMLLDGDAKNFLVTENGRPYGVLSRDHMIKGLSAHGESAPLHLVTDTELSYASLNAPLNDVFAIFQKSKNPLILIQDRDRLAGIIDIENIAELIMIKDAQQQPHSG
jgi:Zn-dependent protease